MTLRLAAVGRQAVLSGGINAEFTDANDLQLVLRNAAIPADVDTVQTGTIFATFIGGANPFAAVADDGTTATLALAANLTTNASAGHDFAANGERVGEIFVGAGRTSGDKFGDIVVDGTDNAGDLNFDSNTIANGGLLTITTFSFTKIN